MTHFRYGFIAVTCAVVATACSGGGPNGPSDGCRSAHQQVVSFATEADVLAFLRNPDNHDSDGAGLINFSKFSDSTCLTAPASANHETLTLVFNGNRPDSVAVSGGSLFVTDFVNSGTDELIPTRTQSGDSVTYVFSATGPTRLVQMLIGAQLRFAPRGGTFEDDITFAATFIRRITFTFDFEAP